MPYQYKCTFKKVIDGDTIIVDIDLGFNIILSDQSLRLIGIDTPESRSKDKIEKFFGLLSKKAVENFINNNKTNEFIIETTLNNDNDEKFGRILAKIYNNNKECLNDWLINNNYAVAYNGENKEKVKNLHLENRKKLIDKGLASMTYSEAGLTSK